MAEPVDEELSRLEGDLKRLQVENQRTSAFCTSSDASPRMSSTNPQFNNTIHQLSVDSNFQQQVVSRPEQTSENSKSLASSKSLDKTCSQQALTHEDCNVEELAGYFDNLLFIPRKMSVMAEMMYM